MERVLIDDRYELGDPLGGGGMSRVYLARDRVLERDVAIKILREQYAEDEQFVERFRREAQNAAALSHPNIVQTYDRGETGDGRYYIAMEHVPEGTLADRLGCDGSLPSRTAAEVASQVADALGAAHEQGVIHRDIKPHNVLVTERGDVKVADFGIARAVEETSISRTSSVLGTAAYMSPEQALGREVGPQSDLYSLGVVLYEMLTGEVPFTAASPTAVSLLHVNERPLPPAEVESEIPEEMNALVMRLLAKDPTDRYESAGELIEDLRRISEGFNPLYGGTAGVAGAAEAVESSGAASEPAPVREPRIYGRRSLKRFATVGVLAVALLSTVGWLVWSGGDPGVSGSLDGVPGEAREAVEGAGESLDAASDAIADPVTGEKEVEVPAVEGLTEEAARERLDQAGFESQTRPRQSSGQDAGLVLEQSVAGGDRAEEDSTILLAVGTGPSASAQSVEMPDLAGTSYSQAESELEDAGLTLGGVQEVSSQTVPAGEIADQDPEPGASVEQGAPVYLATSTGPAQGGSSQGGSSQGTSGGGESQSVAGGGSGGGEYDGNTGSGSNGGNGGAGATAGDDGLYGAPQGNSYAEDQQDKPAYGPPSQEQEGYKEQDDEGPVYEQYEPED